MGDKTKIEWTDATWNPLRGVKGRWHCVKVSPGCKHCYAESLNLSGFYNPDGERLPYKVGADTPRLDAKILSQPLRWRKPRKVFVCSMTDLFLEAHPFEWIAAVFGVMAASPRHTFQVLTKRPERALEFFEWLDGGCDHPHHPGIPTSGGDYVDAILSDAATQLGDGSESDRTTQWMRLYRAADDADRLEAWPLPNVWLGVSAEDQQRADERIPVLLQCPAAVRFVSAEPLLGPIDVARFLTIPGWSGKNTGLPYPLGDSLAALPDLPPVEGIDWIIVGGESGQKARPMHPDWARSLRDQCEEAGVAFHFKQHGAWAAWEHGNRYSIWTRSTDGREADRHKLPFMDPERNEMNRGWLGAAEHHGPLEHHGCVEVYQRIGKKKAGRSLDGRTHDGCPETRGWK